MADSGGHWKTLEEAQKLTQSTKIPGVFEEDVKRVNPLERLPVAQASGTGLKIEWLREKTTAEDSVAEAAQGDTLSWGDSIDYDEVESSLRYMYIQRKLDAFNQAIYGTYNDYEAISLLESEKGLKRKVGARIIYGDTTYGGAPTQFDGLHALAAERGAPWAGSGTNNKLNMDMASGALSLQYLRVLLDAMKHGVDEVWIPGCLGIRLDAAYEEKGFVGLATGTAGSLALLTRGIDDLGKPILYFAGTPLVRTDYLVAEEDGTGTGGTADERGLYTSTEAWSIFAVKFGNVLNMEPGLTYGYGTAMSGGAGDFYDLWHWPRLEDFNAGGIRLDTYGAVLLGSTLCLGRIFDITDAAIVV